MWNMKYYVAINYSEAIPSCLISECFWAFWTTIVASQSVQLNCFAVIINRSIWWCNAIEARVISHQIINKLHYDSASLFYGWFDLHCNGLAKLHRWICHVHINKFLKFHELTWGHVFKTQVPWLNPQCEQSPYGFVSACCALMLTASDKRPVGTQTGADSQLQKCCSNWSLSCYVLIKTASRYCVTFLQTHGKVLHCQKETQSSITME